MKKQDVMLGTGDIAVAIGITIFFAIMAILSLKTDAPGICIWIPGIGVVCGIFMIIYTVIDASNNKAKAEQQKNVAKTIIHDSSFGSGDLILYFDSNTKKVTICLATTERVIREEILDFCRSNIVRTDNNIVVVDNTNNKILSVRKDNEKIVNQVFCLDDDFKKLGISSKNSNASLKAFNDYAFMTDDTNEFVVIITPCKIRVIRYSDIVSITYEENGTDTYNKSLGGAVAGGLLFGEVGAIVGSNTAKAKHNKEVSKMSIKILLRSTSDSTIILTIYDGATLNTNVEASRIMYEGLMKEVSGIKDIFSIIIDIVDKKMASTPFSVPFAYLSDM